MHCQGLFSSAHGPCFIIGLIGNMFINSTLYHITSLVPFCLGHNFFIVVLFFESATTFFVLQYSTVEEATMARGELHNLVWPSGNPKELKVDFIDEEGVCFRFLAGSISTAAVSVSYFCQWTLRATL